MPSKSALLPEPARDEQLLKLLADGKLYSTARVATAFGGETPPLETLAALLGSYGVEIEVVGDDRLRLKHPIELFEADRIVSLPATIRFCPSSHRSSVLDRFH